jgi:MEMO1 family protein
VKIKNINTNALIEKGYVMNFTIKGLGGGGSGRSEVRTPAVAGQFYEGSPGRLQAQLEQMRVEIGEVSTSPGVRALILPHAGYVYSGKAALHGMLCAAGGEYKRAVVIAPTHRVGFQGLAMCSYNAYATPLGEVAIDLDAVNTLRELKLPLLQTLDRAHDNEHALEVEIPILQNVLGDIPIVPLIAGHLDLASVRQLAVSLQTLWGKDTLWVISSDFTHYGHSFGYVPFKSGVQENLRELDLGAVDLINRCDLDGFAKYLEQTGATICGRAAIMLLLAMIENDGDLTGELIEYSTSGELTGDWSHCVSYAAIAFSE